MVVAWTFLAVIAPLRKAGIDAGWVWPKEGALGFQEAITPVKGTRNMKLVEEYANLLKRNSGWLALADRATSEAERIDRFAKAPARIEAVTARDIQALARRYLASEQAVILLVLPGSPGALSRRSNGPLHLPQVTPLGIGAANPIPGKGRSL